MTTYGTVHTDELRLADEVDLRSGGLRVANTRVAEAAAPPPSDAIARAKQAALAAVRACEGYARMAKEEATRTPERLRLSKMGLAVGTFFLVAFLVWPQGSTKPSPADKAAANNLILKSVKQLEDNYLATVRSWGAAPPSASSLALDEADDDTLSDDTPSSSSSSDTGSKAGVMALAPAELQQLRVIHMPCWTGSCDNFLIENDNQDKLADDKECEYWSSQFGCTGKCKTMLQMRNDPLILAFMNQLAESITGASKQARVNGGRITLCITWPLAGTSKVGHGVNFTIDHSMSGHDAAMHKSRAGWPAHNNHDGRL